MTLRPWQVTHGDWLQRYFADQGITDPARQQALVDAIVLPRPLRPGAPDTARQAMTAADDRRARRNAARLKGRATAST